MKKETLFVNQSSSTCGNCGDGCDPTSSTHDKIVGYGHSGEQPGCGKTWKFITTGYLGAENAVKDMRPDLQFIPFLDAHR